MTERQEIYCHACGNYVQFDIDMELDGNHVLECPVCGHEHCRVVTGGRITGERWDTRNPNVFYVSNTSYTATSVYDTSTAGTWSTVSTYDNTYTVTTSTSATGTVFLTDLWQRRS